MLALNYVPAATRERAAKRAQEEHLTIEPSNTEGYFFVKNGGVTYGCYIERTHTGNLIGGCTCRADLSEQYCKHLELAFQTYKAATRAPEVAEILKCKCGKVAAIRGYCESCWKAKIAEDAKDLLG